MNNATRTGLVKTGDKDEGRDVFIGLDNEWREFERLQDEDNANYYYERERSFPDEENATGLIDPDEMFENEVNRELEERRWN